MMMTTTTKRRHNFNGGKMQHIFTFDDETRMYTTTFFSDEAREALENGKFYYKIDGSNGMLRRIPTTLDVEGGENKEVDVDEKKGSHDNDNDDDVKDTAIARGYKFAAYQRLDTRGRKPMPENCIALPTSNNNDNNDDGGYNNGSKNPSEYEGHSYCYEPILVHDGLGKKAKKRNEAMLAVVEKYTEKLLSLDREYISIEWVGKKFNKTPGVPEDVAIAIHSEQVVGNDDDGTNDNLPQERTYDSIRSFLLQTAEGNDDSTSNASTIRRPVEGLIIEYNDTYWKVRSDCFDRKCRFKTHPDTVRPPVYIS